MLRTTTATLGQNISTDCQSAQSINRLVVLRANEGVKPGGTRRDSSRDVSGRGRSQTKLPLSHIRLHWLLWPAAIGIFCLPLPVFGTTSTRQECASEKTDPALIFQRGQDALARGALNDAESAFQAVLKLDPRSAAAHANLGVIAMRRKQWDRALALLRQAEKLEPKMADGIRLNIGLVKYRRGDYGGAIPPLALVVRDQPDSIAPRYLLGLSEVFTQRYTEAVSALEPLWAKMSDNFMYLYVLGIAAHNAGRKDLDEKALTRLVEVGGDSPEFHLILGKAYLNREEPEKSIVELDRAAAGNPNLPFLHLSLGVAYLRTNRDERAEAELRKEIAIDPDLPDNYEQLGELYVRLGRSDEAMQAFQEALKHNPKLPVSLFGLAKLYLQQEKYPAALTFIDSAVHLAPNHQGIHYLRGQILMRLGRREDARAEFATAQKILNSGLNKRRESLEDNPVPNPELAEPPQWLGSRQRDSSLKGLRLK